MLQALRNRVRILKKLRRVDRNYRTGSAGSKSFNNVFVIFWLSVLLFLTLIPIFFMLFISLRSRGQIYVHFWALPSPALWTNYIIGWIGMRTYMLNSLLDGGISVIAVVFLSALSGYVFARQRFPGKEVIYVAILSLMMIPGILTLIPAFVLVNQLHIINTPLALILPWTAGAQMFGILLCRSFIASIPQEIFEAGRIDGASEFQCFTRVAIPLSWPILVTLAIIHFMNVYNDFIWPLISINSPTKQVVAVGLQQFVNEFGITDIGGQMAGYVISVLPLLILFTFGMKYFIQGVAAGALKA
jgi:ABC-type glycerol-3-phosphate transport system permease component